MLFRSQRRLSVCLLAVAAALAAQTQSEQAAPKPAGEKTESVEATGWKRADQAKSAGEFVVEPGTRIPLSMINSVSTKHAAEGDRVYLETIFPILVKGKIIIPPGSYVAGTVTESKRPGKVKGRGELYVRFDSLTLPNGVTRDFRARMGSLDGRANEELDKNEGKIKSEGNKSGDAQTIGATAGAGAGIGSLAGIASNRSGMGAGIGAMAGAAAGAMAVLLTRGPDAVLARGTTLEMLLDRPLVFEASELDFSNAALPRGHFSDGPGPMPSTKTRSSGYPGPRWPF